jgi:hypothetical protein
MYHTFEYSLTALQFNQFPTAVVVNVMMFRRLEILPLLSQYILSLMLFVVKNKNILL